MAEPRSEATQIFGARVREIRNTIGISQMDLGELAGIHFTNIAKLERGEANPSLFTIVRVADALEVDPGFLIEGLSITQIPEQQSQVHAKDYVKDRLQQRRDQQEG